MKQLVIVLGLVMGSMMSAMDFGKTAEGAAQLKISDEVAQMPDNPRKSPKKQVSPATKKAIQESFREKHEALLARYEAEAEKKKLEAEKNNQ
jgi:hypothetical protein